LLDSLLQETLSFTQAMSEYTLMKFLNPKFRCSPPTDVRFWFKEEGGAVKEVKAHTQILGAASEVFYREFYGSLRVENEVEIKDACQEVFQAMIEFIYNKKLVFKDVGLDFLASLYYLAEKYNLEDLINEIVAFIPEYKITKENVLEIALLAEDNILHKELSEALYSVVVRFVKKNKGVVKDFYTDVNEQHALVIFKIIKRSYEVQGELCGNCQQTPCMTGKQVTSGNFVKGAKVQHTSWGNMSALAVLTSDNGLTFRCNYYDYQSGGAGTGTKNFKYLNFFFKCDFNN